MNSDTLNHPCKQKGYATAALQAALEKHLADAEKERDELRETGARLQRKYDRNKLELSRLREVDEQCKALGQVRVRVLVRVRVRICVSFLTFVRVCAYIHLFFLFL